MNDGPGIEENDLFNYSNKGLFTCKSIIEKMKANVTVEAKAGEGTCYSINYRTVCKETEVDIGYNLWKKCVYNEAYNSLNNIFLEYDWYTHVFLVKQNDKSKIYTSLDIETSKASLKSRGGSS